MATMSESEIIGMAGLALAERVRALELALGLTPGQTLCGAPVGPDGQSCLKAEGHTEIVGEGWHSGITWTTSRK